MLTWHFIVSKLAELLILFYFSQQGCESSQRCEGPRQAKEKEAFEAEGYEGE
jgi:hypothetical protein